MASTILAWNIFVSAVQDLKAIFSPSFFILEAILFTIHMYVRYNIGQAAMLSAILKPKSPEKNQSHTADQPTTP